MRRHFAALLVTRGLRDYGLPPLVWGGDEGCEHEWRETVENKRGAGGEREYGSYDGATGRGPAPVLPASQFCQLCGCWRGSLGLEPTPDLYVAHMVEVMREVRRVLRDDGTLWLNLGDSYANPGKGGAWDAGRTQATSKNSRTAHKYAEQPNRGDLPGLKPKDLVGIPWRVAFALQRDGWYLRIAMPWIKKNPMPESVTDRPTTAHEYVFLLSKSKKYYYDQEAVRVGHSREWWTETVNDTPHVVKERNDGGNRQGNGTPAGRNRRTSDTFYEYLDLRIQQQREYLAHLEYVKANGGMLLGETGDPVALMVNTSPFRNVVSYGSYRIASPDCPVHDYRAGLARVRQDGDKLLASLSGHNLDTGDGPAPGQEGAVASIPLGRFSSLSGVSAAILHNIRMSKTVAESERDVIFYGISDDRTEYKEYLARCVSKYVRTHGSKTELDSASDEQGNCPSEQTSFHIVGIEAYQWPPIECTCYYTGMLKRSQGHFAVFPPALVEPCIKAGSSQRGCCPECGAGWIRCVEHRKGDTETQGRPKRTGGMGSDTSTLSLSGNGSKEWAERGGKSTTTGWRPGCTCDAGNPISATVIDIFGGAGTVGLVAEQLGRDSILCELNASYAEMSRQRIDGAPVVECVVDGECVEMEQARMFGAVEVV